eukprot:442498_1
MHRFRSKSKSPEARKTTNQMIKCPPIKRNKNGSCVWKCNFIGFLILFFFLCIILLLYHLGFRHWNNSNSYSRITRVESDGNDNEYNYRHKLHKFYNINIEHDHSTSLRLMSFNLRNALLDTDDTEPYKQWKLRKDLVYHLLNNIQSDLIGTQEGILSQIEDISYHLHSKYGHYGLGRLPYEWYLSSLDPDGMNEHCTIWWNQDKLIPYDEGTFWLSDQPNIMASVYPNSYLPRIANWMLFDIRTSHKYRILFVSTHLGLSSTIREGQIKLIARFIHTMAKDQKNNHEKELLVFIVGDFNEGLKGELWHNLFDSNDNRSSNPTEEEDVNVADVLTDCVLKWEQMQNRTLNINITFHAFEGIRHLQNDKNHAPIDWILCSKNVIENEDIVLLDTYVVTKTRVDYKYTQYSNLTNHTIYPSDHFPIVLELVLLDDTNTNPSLSDASDSV